MNIKTTIGWIIVLCIIAAIVTSVALNWRKSPAPQGLESQIPPVVDYQN